MSVMEARSTHTDDNSTPSLKGSTPPFPSKARRQSTSSDVTSFNTFLDDLDWLEPSLCSSDSFSSGSETFCASEHQLPHFRSLSRHSHPPRHRRRQLSSAPRSAHTFPSPSNPSPHLSLNFHPRYLPRAKSPPRSVDSPRNKAFVDYMTEELPELNILRLCLPSFFPKPSQRPASAPPPYGKDHCLSSKLASCNSYSSFPSSTRSSPALSRPPSHISFASLDLKSTPLEVIHENPPLDMPIAMALDSNETFTGKSVLLQMITEMLWTWLCRMQGNGADLKLPPSIQQAGKKIEATKIVEIEEEFQVVNAKTNTLDDVMSPLTEDERGEL